MSEVAQAPKPNPLEFLGLNFAIVSALVTFASAFLAMLFFVGYISVFNIYLIMTIEYADIGKYIFIVLSIIFPSLIAVFGVAAYLVRFVRGHASERAALLMLMLTVLASLTPVFLDWSKGLFDTQFDVMRMVASAMAAGGIYHYAFTRRYREVVTFETIGFFFVLAGCLALLLGAIYGLHVRDRSTPNQLVVRLANLTEKVIPDARLVLFTSHHVIVKIGSSISTFPTSNVLEVISPINDQFPTVQAR